MDVDYYLESCRSRPFNGLVEIRGSALNVWIIELLKGPIYDDM